jgi:hypothetical protein
MRRKTLLCAATLLLATLLTASDAHAACLNKFVVQSQNNKRIVTLLTGEITFVEAKELSRALKAKEAGVIEWLDPRDQVIVAASGFDVVRPMPVACGDRKSGVVATIELVTFATPSKTMRLRFPDGRTVTFTEQGK